MGICGGELMPRTGAQEVNSGQGLNNILINSRNEINQRREFIGETMGFGSQWGPYYMDRFVTGGFTNWQGQNTNYFMTTGAGLGPFGINYVKINDTFGTTRFGHAQRVENIRLTLLPVGTYLSLIFWVRKAQGAPSLSDYNVYLTHETPGTVHNFGRPDGMPAAAESEIIPYNDLPVGDAAAFTPLKIVFQLTQQMKDNGVQVGFRMIQDNEGAVPDNQGDFFDLGPMMLLVGMTDENLLQDIPRFAKSRELDDEFRYCLRYFEKSYNTGVQLGANNFSGSAAFSIASTGFFRKSIEFAEEKRTAGILTNYNPVTGTVGEARRDSGTAIGVGSANTGTHGATFQTGGGNPVGVEYRTQWALEAEL